MIPKLIHCFWFSGDRKPPLVERCLASWRKCAPEFEIREWNVEMLRAEFGEAAGTTGIRSLPRFAEDALAAKKWAFASDWARFAVIERFGGVYLDLDVELIKPIDALVADGKGFFALNDDSRQWVDPGLGFAAPAGEAAIAAIARRYETLAFDPACPMSMTCPAVANAVFYEFRRSGRELPRFLPARYFDPKGGCAGEVKLSPETCAIHHYAASWFGWKQRLAYRILPRLGINVHPLVKLVRKFWIL